MLEWLGVVCTHTSAIYSVVNIAAPETPFLRHTCHDGRMNRKIARARSPKPKSSARKPHRRASRVKPGRVKQVFSPILVSANSKKRAFHSLIRRLHVEMINVITSISSTSTVHDYNLQKNNSDLPVASVTAIIKDTTTKRVAGMLVLVSESRPLTCVSSHPIISLLQSPVRPSPSHASVTVTHYSFPLSHVKKRHTCV